MINIISNLEKICSDSFRQITIGLIHNDLYQFSSRVVKGFLEQEHLEENILVIGDRKNFKKSICLMILFNFN